jgi:hypothetical protein
MKVYVERPEKNSPPFTGSFDLSDLFGRFRTGKAERLPRSYIALTRRARSAG